MAIEADSGIEKLKCMQQLRRLPGVGNNFQGTPMDKVPNMVIYTGQV